MAEINAAPQIQKAVARFMETKKKERLLFNGELEPESFFQPLSSGFGKYLGNILLAHRFRVIDCTTPRPKIVILGVSPTDDSVSSTAGVIKTFYSKDARNLVPDFLDFMLGVDPYNKNGTTPLAKRVCLIPYRHLIIPTTPGDNDLGNEELIANGRLMNLLREGQEKKSETAWCIDRIMQIHDYRIHLIKEKLEEQSRKTGYSLALVDIGYFCDPQLFQELTAGDISFLAACWNYNTIRTQKSDEGTTYTLVLPETRWGTAGNLFGRFEELIERELCIEKNELVPEIRRSMGQSYCELKTEYLILGEPETEHRMFTVGIKITRKKPVLLETTLEERTASFELTLPEYLDKDYSRIILSAMQQM